MVMVPPGAEDEVQFLRTVSTQIIYSAQKAAFIKYSLSQISQTEEFRENVKVINL